MIKGYKVRLIPTKEQEELMFKSVGCSRFAWNWALNKNKEYREQGKNWSLKDVWTDFGSLKEQEEYKWLKEVSNKVTEESLRNLDKAFKQFFKGKKGFPKFKSKKKNKQSFYVRYNRLYFLENKELVVALFLKSKL